MYSQLKQICKHFGIPTSSKEVFRTSKQCLQYLLKVMPSTCPNYSKFALYITLYSCGVRGTSILATKWRNIAQLIPTAEGNMLLLVMYERAVE